MLQRERAPCVRGGAGRGLRPSVSHVLDLRSERATPSRILALNILAGGGPRVPRIAEALLSREPDVVVLGEYHANRAEKELAAAPFESAGFSPAFEREGAMSLAPVGPRRCLFRWDLNRIVALLHRCRHRQRTLRPPPAGRPVGGRPITGSRSASLARRRTWPCPFVVR